jgi:twinkle protein
MNNITPALLKDMLASQVESVCMELLPNGKKMGNEWCVGSPAGEAGESCKVHLTGKKAGLWRDFAGNEGGDLLDLYQKNRGTGLKEAMEWACKFVGVQRTEFAKPKKTFKRPERPADARSLKKANEVFEWLNKVRRLDLDTIEAYKVVAKGSDTVLFPYLRDDELIHIKFRAVKEKKFWSSGETEKCLFGWQAISPRAREVTITEGELDAMAMYQLGYPALSVPFGGGGAGKQDWIENEYENLERFDVIYLCLDQDDAGIEATTEIVRRLGRARCRVVTLPTKDANQALIENVPLDKIRDAMRTAKTLDPDELRNVSEYTDQVIARFYPPDNQSQGFLLPWEETVDQFKFEYGATTLLAGYAGHGKSQIIGQITLDAIRQDVKCCVASLEFKAERFLARLVRQATCDIQPPKDRISKCLEETLHPSLWAFDVAKGQTTLPRLLEVFEYAYKRYGCKFFVLDNLSKLADVKDESLDSQKKAIVDVTAFAVEHDVHIVVVAHMRKDKDDSNPGGRMGIKGAGALTDLADNVLIMYRNRKKEARLKTIDFEIAKAEGADRTKLQDEKAMLMEKSDAFLFAEKVREMEIEFSRKLWFDHRSTQFVARPEGKPRIYG